MNDQSYHGNISVIGSLALTNLSGLPANPRPYQIAVINGQACIYTDLGAGFYSWFPMATKRTAYVHSQGVASINWTVSHNMDTQDLGVFVYDTNHNLVMANYNIIDSNSIQVFLTEALQGTAVVFGVPGFTSASGVLDSGVSGIEDVPGLLEALSSKATVADIDSAVQAIVGSAPLALDTLQEIAAQLANDQNAVGALVTAIDAKPSMADVNGAISTYDVSVQASLTGLHDALNLRTTPTDVIWTLQNTPLSGLPSVITALNAKASISYVDAAIADAGVSVSGIADVPGLQTELNSKATTAYVDSALTAKATTAYVDSALTAKATTAYVDSALTAKASTAYVDSALTAKASTAYVDSAIAAIPEPTGGATVSGIADVPGLQTALDAKVTSSDVSTAIQAVVGAAPAALNTLQEIAAQLANDESAVSALTSVVSTKASTTVANSWSSPQTFEASIKEKMVDLTTGSNIDLSLGSVFKKTITGATTFSISNTPPAGVVSSFILEMMNGGASTVTWWANLKWAGGTVPTRTTTGVDVYGFYTHDGGATWRGFILAKDSK